MLIYTSSGLRIAEVWFNESPAGIKADIIRYRHVPESIPGAVCTPRWTLLIDLGKSEDELWSKLNRNTRQDIKRARSSHGVICRSWDHKDFGVLDRFCSFYNNFARMKGVGEASPEELIRYAQASSLDISWAETPHHGPLVYHSHIIMAGRARAWHSGSLFRSSPDSEFRNMIGGANRTLHWTDMLRFRSEGVHTYDFGGWYTGTDDKERMRINIFKEGFGGTPSQGWNGEQLVTLRARLAVPVVRRMRTFLGSMPAAQ
jgi:hypothetical protein